MDEQRRKQLEALAAGGTATSSPGGLPPDIEALVSSMKGTAGGPKSIGPRGVSMTPPVPASQAQGEMRQKLLMQMAEQQLKPSAEDAAQAATRKQLLKKAADQKLQLEQAIGLFQKIYQESESAVPVIQHPAGTLPFQQASRYVGQKMGLREQQRGTISSLQARATPALKSLGEVGVLTNQDIERMLKGGFPSDDDTAVSRFAKQQGIISDLQMKLDQVNTVLGSPPTAQGAETDPHVTALQQQFPGAKITKVQ